MKAWEKPFPKCHASRVLKRAEAAGGCLPLPSPAGSRGGCLHVLGSLRGAHKNWSSLLFSHHLATFSQLRQLLLESQSQLDVAKSEAQKQSDELALVSGRGVTTCAVGAGYACSHTQSEGTWVGC